MAESWEEGCLDVLLKRLEALPEGAFMRHVVNLDTSLSILASICNAATIGKEAIVDSPNDLGARACKALLRIPVTVASEALAQALWEVVRFNGVRRIQTRLSLELSRRLGEVGRLIGNADWVRKSHLAASNMHFYSGSYATAVEEAWTALKLARANGSQVGVGSAWNGLGNGLSGAGLFQAATGCYENALAAAELIAASDEERNQVRTSALNNLAMSAACLGNFRKGLEAAEQASGARTGDTSTWAAASSTVGGVFHVYLLLETGNVQRARVLCNELLRISPVTGSDALVAEVHLVDGLCRVFEGELQAGLSAVRQALEDQRHLSGELRTALRFAIRAHELAREVSIADMYRRELALCNRLVQQEGMLEQHRSHLRRLQAEDGNSVVTLERKAEMVERLAITTELREDPTGLGVFRVGRLARLLAEELGWSDPDAEALEIAARLHDIGKISVADDIVAAPRPLTAEETQSMRTHCQVGAELLRQTELENARLAADVAAYHHEAWDGSGYPHGIGGTAIPLAARIVAIADAFVAMTSDRPFRPRLGSDEALARLQAGAGSRYDPALVAHFVALVGRLVASVDDLDAFLAEAAGRSPFMQVHQQLTRRLAQGGSPL